MQHNLLVLLTIAVSGAFGGFVHGLLAPKDYKFRLGKRLVNLGSAGDALTGATAGIAIFAVAGGLLKVDLEKMAATDEFIRVIAWGVLSGFAGVRLLEPMTEKFVKQIVGEEIERGIKGLAAKSVETSIDIDLANGCITKYEVDKKLSGSMVKKEDLEKDLADAQNAVDRVLQREPTNEEALRIKAKIYKRKAAECADPKDKIPLYDEAIALTNRIVAINPRSEIGYYNRACYMALLRTLEPNMSLDGILESLGEAIKLSETNMKRATEDPDFDSIKREPSFQKLTGQQSVAAASTPSR
jgi:hypothetical protein